MSIIITFYVFLRAFMHFWLLTNTNYSKIT